MPYAALCLPEDSEEVTGTVPVVTGQGRGPEQVAQSVDMEEHRRCIQQQEQADGQDEGKHERVEEPGQPL